MSKRKKTKLQKAPENVKAENAKAADSTRDVDDVIDDIRENVQAMRLEDADAAIGALEAVQEGDTSPVTGPEADRLACEHDAAEAEELGTTGRNSAENIRARGYKAMTEDEADAAYEKDFGAEEIAEGFAALFSGVTLRAPAPRTQVKAKVAARPAKTLEESMQALTAYSGAPPLTHKHDFPGAAAMPYYAYSEDAKAAYKASLSHAVDLLKAGTATFVRTSDSWSAYLAMTVSGDFRAKHLPAAIAAGCFSSAQLVSIACHAAAMDSRAVQQSVTANWTREHGKDSAKPDEAKEPPYSDHCPTRNSETNFSLSQGSDLLFAVLAEARKALDVEPYLAMRPGRAAPPDFPLDPEAWATNRPTLG